MYIPIHNRRIDSEITDLKDQQQRCLSRIDDLEDQHQADPSTHSNLQPNNWNQMRNTVNETTRKEIEFLETNEQERKAMASEYEALTRAKDSGTLPVEEWREKLTDLLKREGDIRDELRQRKRLRLDISEKGRMDVTCTREDWSHWRHYWW